jgi:preprotein translocase subunit SecE
MATEKSIPSPAPAPKPRAATSRSEHRLVKYLREVGTELKKTNWPSKPELISETQIVIGVLIALGVFVAAWDQVLGLIIKGLMRIFGIHSAI